MTSPQAPGRGVIAVAIAVMCLVWGSTWVVIKGGLDDLPPFTSAGVRFVLAALCMVVVARLLADREGGARPPLWLAVYQGILNFGPSYAIVYWCETRLPSGIVAVLWAVYPLLVGLVAHFALPAERLRPAQALGFVLGFLGVGSLFATRVIASDVTLAALLLLVSPLVSAIGTVIVKKHGSEVSSLLLCRNAFAVTAVLLVSLALLFEGDADVSWTLPAILSVVYLALFGTVLAFGLYWWVLRYATAGGLSLIAYVVPLLALVFGALLGREQVGVWTLVGTALILLGVLLAARARGQRRGEMTTDAQRA